MGVLCDFLPRQTYGVVGAYRHDELVAQVAAVLIDETDGLFLQFAQEHAFRAGDAVTVQLDGRMQVSHLTEQLPVHRTSYRGRVTDAGPEGVRLVPVQFQVYYSDKLVGEYHEPGFTFPPDPRPEMPLVESSHGPELRLRADDAGTSLGVLFTRAVDRPHSTVMAFLSAGEGDVFLVTNVASFKAHNLARDPRALFAVDYRDSYDLAKPITWAYRLLPMRASLISPQRPLHDEVRETFLRKNPWNVNFFTARGSFLVHLAPVKDKAHPAAGYGGVLSAASRLRAK